MMKTSLVEQFCRSIQEEATTKRFRDAGIGFLFIVFNQLLVVPAQIVLNLHSVNLPASILVMLLLSVLMIIASYVNGSVAQFYTKHLRGPSDFLSRHMSLGFVALFVKLNQDHITDSSDVPKIAGTFIITTIMSYLGAFLFAAGGFKLEQRIRGLHQRKHNDLESNNKSWPSPSSACPATPIERSSKRISQLSSLSIVVEKNVSLTSTEPATKTSTCHFIDFLVRDAPIWICLLLLVGVGLPIYLATRYEMPFEALCFLLLWILSIQFQRYLRSSFALLRYPRIRSTLIIFANPLLMTWALGSAYLWTKVACTRQTINVVVTNFRRHNSLADCLVNIIKDHDLPSNLGAGDLAAPILDAGIVCLGLKMYEYRAELWASFGTVFSTCTLLAVINVFLNVLVGHAVGLQREEAIAFAGRSVTMALGVPAIENLGGSTTLMSAVAIFSGILFHMTGDWVFSALRINDRASQQCDLPHPETHLPVPPPSLVEENSATTAKAISGDDTKKAGVTVSVSETSEEKLNDVGGCGTDDRDESTVVAAGVMVGINAAAMGTAYLIERDSRATAYSALSMTVFGAMTVALTALPGVSEAMVALTSI
ncbi:hypothetical protein F5X99DRAFT_355763 [Biscogniauxia marginata]|nr:hypothetical protein F5X99DRAFT_355763 [Biscogniauxia marginata]